MPRVPAVLLALALSTTLVACGGEPVDDPTVAAPSAAPTQAAPEAEAEPVACEEVPATAEPGPDATTDLAVKPVPVIEDGDPPCGLVITDIVVGEGAEAVPGSTASVKYVGVLYEDGSEFDSSWSRGDDETLPVPVGAGRVIPGFDTAVEGMRVGGRRQVVIPSDLGYGPAGQGPIPPGATLVFVLDLIEVTPAP